MQKKADGFLSTLKNVVKEPAFLAMMAAPLAGMGVARGERFLAQRDAAKKKTEAFRSMMELHPQFKERDQSKVVRLYNSLHNVNPTMAHDPLVAGAWIDNIFETESHLGSGSSAQGVLAAVKDLAGIRSQMSQAARHEGEAHSPVFAPIAEKMITGMGDGIQRAITGQSYHQIRQELKSEEDRLTAMKQDLAHAVREAAKKHPGVTEGLQSKKASDESDDGLTGMFDALGIT